MTNFFQEAIPIRELIKAPLTSAMEADYDLATSSIKFIEEFGLVKNSNNQFCDIKKLNFNFSIDEENTSIGDQITSIDTSTASISDIDVSAKKANIPVTTTYKNSYSIPLLALVNPPNLRIKNVDIDFAIELDHVSNSSGTTESSKNNNPFQSYGRLSRQSNTTSTTTSTTTQTTNTSSYKFKINAVNEGPTEGMYKILDLMNNIAAEKTNVPCNNIKNEIIRLDVIQSSLSEASQNTLLSLLK